MLTVGDVRVHKHLALQRLSTDRLDVEVATVDTELLTTQRTLPEGSRDDVLGGLSQTTHRLARTI